MYSKDWIMIGFKTIVVLLFGGLIALIIYGASQPYEKVNNEEAYKYSGKKISTEIKAITELNGEMELEFLMPIIISTGKTTMITYIPIFDKYKVFTSDAGIYLAFDGNTPQIDKTLIVDGVVKEDKSGRKFAIQVDKWSYKDGSN
jgi:hypothetical protein